MPPTLNRRRALFVLSKIDQILAWEQGVDNQRDTKFVELGRYLCEVRAGQYWRLQNLKSFDEFLERRFPESRRKAYYLMSIHEHLPKPIRRELKQVGWAKAVELVKLARKDPQRFESATWLHKARSLPKQEFKAEVERELTGRDTEPSELMYFKIYKSQMPGNRAGAGHCSADAGIGQIARLLSGDDLRRLPGRGTTGERRSQGTSIFHAATLPFSSRGREARIPARGGSGCVTRLPKDVPFRLDSVAYRQLRRRVLERDGWRCQTCGAMKNLEVHHTQFRTRRGHDTEDNLVTLCSECHKRTHVQARAWSPSS